MGKGLGWAVLGAMIAFAVLIGISLLTWKQRDSAISQAATAEAASTMIASEASTGKANAEEAQHQTAIAIAEKLAAQSLYEQDRNFQLSLLLGIEAYKTFETPITRSVLLQGAEYQPQLLHFLTNNATSGSDLAFSPDSKTLAVGGCEKRNESGGGCAQSTIRFWNVSTGQSTGQITSPASLVSSPDGKTLAFGNSDGSVTLKDATTLEMIGQPLRANNVSGTPGLDFSSDGKILAIESIVGGNSDASSINLWDVASQTLIGSIQGIPFGPSSLAFSSDGKTLLFLGWENDLIGWNIATQTRVKEPKYQGNIPSLGEPALSADGKIAAIAPFLGEGYVQDGGIVLWDATTGKPIQTLVGFSNRCGIHLAFSPDSKTLASGCFDGTIILWDLVQSAYVMNPEQLTGHPLKGHTGAVWSLTFSPDGKTLASSGDDGAVILWSVAEQTPVGQQLKGPSKESVDALGFNLNGTTLSVARDDGIVELWDVISNQRREAPINTHSDVVSGVVFRPDAKILAIGHYDNAIDLWDLVSQQQVGPPLLANSKALYPQTFSPDGNILAASSFEHTILLWDVETGKLIGVPITATVGSAGPVTFNPDGTILASGNDDNTISLWNVESQKAIGDPFTGHDASITALAFSPDGKVLASGDNAGEIILWRNVTTNQIIKQVLYQPPQGSVPRLASLVFSPDGRTLASSTDSITLWDVSTGKPIGQPLPAVDYFDLNSIAFSPNGRTLAAGGSDGTVTLWDLDPQDWIENSCQRSGRNFTQDEWRQYFPNEAYRITCPEWPANNETTPISTPTASP